MKLNDLPEKYRRQAEAQLHPARPHANVERGDAPALDKVEASERFTSPVREGVNYERHDKTVSDARFAGAVRVHFHHVRKRLADLDNLCAKAALDGLVACGILEDDRQEFVKEIRHTQEKGSEERTEVTVEEI